MMAGGFHLNSAVKLSKQWGPPLDIEEQVMDQDGFFRLMK
jgi:hypothetical protein